MTYSIVARDPVTGELGVAVQSHWFSVGPIVPWAEPGVGAVATQANADVGYGPGGLELLRQGTAPAAALGQLVAVDQSAATRQVGIVDAAGRVAVHTGEACIPFAGHAIGDGVCCQANMMATEDVWPAMLAAFTTAPGRLPGRLLAALDAGEAAGGDVRGRQSSAMLVVPAEGKAWQAAISLRVEDHPEPLVELRRLLALNDAYTVAGEADQLLGAGQHAQASVLYRRALELAPGNAELSFWAGLAAAYLGDLDVGTEQVAAAIEAHPPWLDLLERLSPAVAPAAATVLARLSRSS